jgi:methyl-accepting chemotaxis protein
MTSSSSEDISTTTDPTTRLDLQKHRVAVDQLEATVQLARAMERVARAMEELTDVVREVMKNG